MILQPLIFDQIWYTGRKVRLSPKMGYASPLGTPRGAPAKNQNLNTFLPTSPIFDLKT